MLAAGETDGRMGGRKEEGKEQGCKTVAPLITNSVSYLFAQQCFQRTTLSCDITDPKTQTHHKNKARNPLIIEQTEKINIVHSVQTYAPTVATPGKGVTLKIEKKKKDALWLTHTHRNQRWSSLLCTLFLSYMPRRGLSAVSQVAALHSRTAAVRGCILCCVCLFGFFKPGKISTSPPKIKLVIKTRHSSN